MKQSPRELAQALALAPDAETRGRLLESANRRFYLPSPTEFFTSPAYGNMRNLYPNVLRLVELILSPPVHEYYVEIGKGGGKSQVIDEPVLTPNGWKPIGDLYVQDEIISGTGEVTTVSCIYDRGLLPNYKVTFNDGSWTRCSDDHLWKVGNPKTDEWEVVSLRAIRLFMSFGGGPMACIPTLPHSSKKYRAFQSIVPVGIHPSRCIRVAHPDGTYVTRDDIVTHNSTVAAACVTYSAARLLALKDPHDYFGLQSTKPIVCLTVATSEEQAKRTIFSQVRAMISNNPFFKGVANPRSTDIELDDGKVLIICGHSKSEGMEGHDVFFANIDEANKHGGGSAAGKEQVRRLRDTFISSSESRFPYDYKVGCISSSVSMEDFQRQEIEYIKTHGKEVDFKTGAEIIKLQKDVVEDVESQGESRNDEGG